MDRSFYLSIFSAAYDSCLNLKPCTDVTYSVEVESFNALTSQETRYASRCLWTDRPSLLSLLFSRRIIWEDVSFSLEKLGILGKMKKGILNWGTENFEYIPGGLRGETCRSDLWYWRNTGTLARTILPLHRNILHSLS